MPRPRRPRWHDSRPPVGPGTPGGAPSLRPRWVRRGFRAGRRLVNSRVPPSWPGRADLEAGLPRAPIPGHTEGPLCTPHAASDPLSTTTPAASKKAVSRIEPATQLTQAACRGDLGGQRAPPQRQHRPGQQWHSTSQNPWRRWTSRALGFAGALWSSQGRGVGVRPSLPSSSCQQKSPFYYPRVSGPGPLPVV